MSTEKAPSGLAAMDFTARSPILSTSPSCTVLATDGVPVIPEGEMCLKGYSSLSLQ
jgi:hypothetical protein